MRFWAMTRCERSWHWVTLVLVVVVFAVAPQKLFGQGFSRLSIPVPVDIDGQSTRSTMYLKAEMKIINQRFDQFAAGGADKAGSMFVEAVQALRKNDAKAFGRVWSSPDEMKNAGHSESVKLSDNTPGGWVKLIRGMFNFDQLTVFAEVLVGPDTMFLWDAQTKDGMLRRVFYVGPDKSGRTRLSAPGDEKPIQLLLLNAFDAARTEPDSYKPLPNINLRYQYPIPLAGTHDSGAHPVFLEFDGLPMDFSLTDEKVKPPTPALAFLRGATLAYRSGKNDIYSGSFTPKSQEKVKQWLVVEEKQKQERLKQEKLKQANEPTPPAAQPVVPPAAEPQPAAKPPDQSANVKFVLNADPIFLVFQAPGKGSSWLAKNLSYSYILRQGSEYKLTNFAYASTLDGLLQDPSLFDKNVLKPAVAKPGAPNAKGPDAKGVPAAAKPTTVNKN
jgi:hypothetical protein